MYVCWFPTNGPHTHEVKFGLVEKEKLDFL